MTVLTNPDAAPDLAAGDDSPSRKRRFARTRTTPGLLGVLLIALVVSSLTVGAISALSVLSREQTLQDLGTTNGQLHAAAEEFYRSLSHADVAAGEAFLARDQKRATDRVKYETKYESSVSEAQSALATLVAAGDAETDTARRNVLATLPGRLSEYTVLVETARAYNRQGQPVAATYQLLAADAMRAHLLPAANDLHDAANDRVASDQTNSTSLPILEVSLALFVLLVLIGVQVFLWRRTNRIFNIGLGVATLAAVALLAWTGVAAIAASQNAQNSKDEGTSVINALNQARITALAARGNEALSLVAGKDQAADDGEYAETFGNLRDRLTGEEGLLSQAKAAASNDSVREQVDAAAKSARTWLAEHDKLRSAARNGNHKQAVETLMGADGDGAFTAVDDSLGAAIDDTRQRFDTEVTDASIALTGAVAGVIGLATLIAFGAGFGVWQRLREYR